MAAHLGLAMLLLGLLLWLSSRARAESRPLRPARTVRPTSVPRPEAVRAPAAVLLLCAIVAGGYMAGTEEEGVNGDRQNIAGAHLACGEQFPDLRRRPVPAVRRQPADRYPPDPPRLRLRGHVRDPRACSAWRSPAARAIAARSRGAAAGDSAPARRAQRLARRARDPDRRPPDRRPRCSGRGVSIAYTLAWSPGSRPCPLAGRAPRSRGLGGGGMSVEAGHGSERIGRAGPRRAGSGLGDPGPRGPDHARRDRGGERLRHADQAADHLPAAAHLRWRRCSSPTRAGRPSRRSCGRCWAATWPAARGPSTTTSSASPTPAWRAPAGARSPAAGSSRAGASLRDRARRRRDRPARDHRQRAAAALAGAGLLGYVFVYTLWLKPRTPQNIVLGGAAGAMPPLVGWAAATGGLSPQALWPFAIVFFWTPPHFWALSLLISDDYARTGVPMLPVVRGEATTRHQILGYALLLVAITIGPVLTGLFGTAYLVAALALGAGFIGLAAGARWRIPPGGGAPPLPRARSPTWRCCSSRWPSTGRYRVPAVDRERARANIRAGLVAGSDRPVRVRARLLRHDPLPRDEPASQADRADLPAEPPRSSRPVRRSAWPP